MRRTAIIEILLSLFLFRWTFLNSYEKLMVWRDFPILQKDYYWSLWTMLTLIIFLTVLFGNLISPLIKKYSKHVSKWDFFSYLITVGVSIALIVGVFIEMRIIFK
ncbi:MAG: hypothetical protein OXE77_08535 [Flavobacteriaceae bacterium]|nr:hypothetical protein [Flavobacteriaceae bacterium]MCY4267262.1 hypothetical protein [Flavobacteriaceae bacterium]